MPEGTDRYNVDPGDPGKRLEERLRAIEQKVEEALRRNPLRNASMTDGAFRILDAAGNQQIVIGKQSDGTYGIWSYDDAGNVVLKLGEDGLSVLDAVGTLRVRAGYIDASAGYGVKVRSPAGGTLFNATDDGLRFPALNTPWIPQLTAFTGVFTPITDASFVNVYQSEWSQITHLGFAATVVCTSDAGTTGEFRISADAGGTTSSVTVPAASASTMQAFEWLHGLSLNTGPTSFRVQARRTGGAGNINVYLPARASLVDNTVCTSTGL